MKTSYLALALAAITTPALAASHNQPQPFSYDYIEVAHFKQTFQQDIGLPDKDIDASGNSITASYLFDPGVLLQLGYTDGQIDKIGGYKPKELIGSSVDGKQWNAFVGGAGSPNDKTSFFGGFGYSHVRWETDYGNTEADAISFGGGARYWLIPMLELDGGAAYVHSWSGSDHSNDFEVSAGLRFQPIKWGSIGVSYVRVFDHNAHAVQGDVRVQF